MKRSVLLIGFAVLATPLGCWASAPQSADQGSQVREIAEQAVRARYTNGASRLVILPPSLDSRLHLAGCAHALTAQLPASDATPSQAAVQVSCPGIGGWTIRVLVRMQLFRQVLVTSRPLARGDSVGAGDVHTEERDVTRLGYGYVQDVTQLAGRSLARPLSSGSVLSPAQLNSREMVRAGDQVQLIAQIGGIEVRTSGLAMDGGDTGSRLRVRNAHSGRVIDAVVLTAGQVQALP